jgi:endogenous inhibitor of DNA gyrase (YacG/DUF329 family)
MTLEKKAARTVRCPGCGADSPYSTENPYRPFCSARCKNNDLGAWASEDYAVPAQPEPAATDVTPDPPQAP